MTDYAIPFLRRLDSLVSTLHVYLRAWIAVIDDKDDDEADRPPLVESPSSGSPGKRHLLVVR